MLVGDTLVSGYNRTRESVSITVSTDWGTQESVELQQENGGFEPYSTMQKSPSNSAEALEFGGALWVWRI